MDQPKRHLTAGGGVARRSVALEDDLTAEPRDKDGWTRSAHRMVTTVVHRRVDMIGP